MAVYLCEDVWEDVRAHVWSRGDGAEMASVTVGGPGVNWTSYMDWQFSYPLRLGVDVSFAIFFLS